MSMISRKHSLGGEQLALGPRPTGGRGLRTGLNLSKVSSKSVGM